jgi:IS605 OrfB family transposase
LPSESRTLRARIHIADNERRIKDLTHIFSRRLITFAEQFENLVIRMEGLEGICEDSSWLGVRSWHFHQLQQLITYKAERAGIRVEKVDVYHTSRQCSVCGSMGSCDGDHFLYSEYDK